MAGKHTPRTFDIQPAVRVAGNIKIGLFSPSGGGKTWSALELATGIQSVVGGDIGMFDTEHRRGTHYAGAFKFQHIDARPPYGSLDYRDGIQALERSGCRTIIVDSMSHEHDGPGGMLEFHETEVDRIAGDGANYARRESVKMLAWREPKDRRRKLLRALVETDANLILCFRAKESAKPVKVTGDDGRSKMEVVQMGFVPIAGDEFLFEMDLCALFMPAAQGVATWSSDMAGERLMIKVPRQFEAFRNAYASKPLDRELGATLARWAQGGAKKPAAAPEAPDSEPPQAEQRATESGTGAGAVENSGDLVDRASEPIEAEEERPEPPPWGEDVRDDDYRDPPVTGAMDDDADNGRAPLKVEPENPFATFANAVAEAQAWAPIRAALQSLTASPEFKAAADGFKSRARTIAYFRWSELRDQNVDTGLKDFLDDPHAMRCYLEAETDAEAIVGNMRVFEASELYKALALEAMTAFQRAAQVRIAALTSASKSEDFS